MLSNGSVFRAGPLDSLFTAAVGEKENISFCFLRSRALAAIDSGDSGF